MLLDSQILSQLLAKRLILGFFHQSLLSQDAYDLGLGSDVINGRSKLRHSDNFIHPGAGKVHRECHHE